MPTAHEILGLAPDASADAIRRAYRKLARAAHPDVTGGSAARMVEINLAYESLKSGVPTPRRPLRRQDTASFVDPFEFLLKVFRPADSDVASAVRRLDHALSDLSNDVFDDGLLAIFQERLGIVRELVDRADVRLRSNAWPEGRVTALNLYLQGLRHFDDALTDFSTFLLNFDFDLLVSGKEFLRAGQDKMGTARTSLA